MIETALFRQDYLEDNSPIKDCREAETHFFG